MPGLKMNIPVLVHNCYNLNYVTVRKLFNLLSLGFLIFQRQINNSTYSSYFAEGWDKIMHIKCLMQCLALNMVSKC